MPRLSTENFRIDLSGIDGPAPWLPGNGYVGKQQPKGGTRREPRALGCRGTVLEENSSTRGGTPKAL